MYIIQRIKTMKKLIILSSLILFIFIGKAQDTTAVFINDTIPPRIIVDTVLFASEMIVIDTISIDKEFKRDLLLMPWFTRDSVYINEFKFALRHVQRGYKRYGTNNIIRFYRYRDIRYIKYPEQIKTKVIYN